MSQPATQSGSTSTQLTPSIDHAALGIGARVSLAPMTDGFVHLLLDVLAATPREDVVVSSDAISTHVTGSELSILRYLRDLIAATGATGVHTLAHVLLSRGCPGEVTCGPVDAARFAPPPLPPLPLTGLTARAQWALYPLLDAVRSEPVRRTDLLPATDHMSEIWSVIERARVRGIYVGGHHFVTELAGDVSEVLDTVAEGWLTVGRRVPHVATHVTLSLNHPETGAVG